MPRFDPTQPEHVSGATAEEQLAQRVHSLPDQVVVRWGDPIGAHGNVTISVNKNNGEVTLWDSKFRSRNVRIQESPTFKAGSAKRTNAINEAIETIQNNKTLPESIRQKALENLVTGKIQTRTVGAGNAKNSVLGS